MVKIANIELGEFPLLLAPMEDVSDPPFRKVCKANGADLMYTEFISSEGLIRDAAKSVQKLDIFDYERPIGIQIFGSDISSMREATEIATLAGPDGAPVLGRIEGNLKEAEGKLTGDAARTCYFKTGSYVQSNPERGDAPDAVAEVFSALPHLMRRSAEVKAALSAVADLSFSRGITCS